MRTLGLICSAAGGVERIRESLVEPAITRGWRVAVTLTPAAGRWLAADGEIDRIAQATGLPCRVESRMPADAPPHPPIDCFLIAPATFNTVAKLALGLGDNQALTTAVEAVGAGTGPIAVLPLINAAHARHPAWRSHVTALESAGVHVLLGAPFWIPREPRSALDRDPPWREVLTELDALMSSWEAARDRRARGGSQRSV